jgi:uncharacterized protein YjbI with pentapeptide repeats
VAKAKCGCSSGDEDQMADESLPKIPISSDWIVKRIKEGKNVRLKNALVSGNLDLSNLGLPTEHVERTNHEIINYDLSENVKVVTSRIIVTDSRIEDEVNVNNTSFKGRVDFSNTDFFAHVNFLGAQFFGHVNFNGTYFYGSDFAGVSADFTGAKFNGNAVDFVDAHFSGGALFTDTQFNGKDVSGTSVSFMRAKFIRRDDLCERLQFTDSALFILAPVQFVGADFNGGAIFQAAHFDGDANFMDAQFSVGADFRGAQFGGRINLTISKFDRIYVRWHELKDSLFYDGPTYLLLIKNFKILELWDDAESCYYQYRRIAQTKKPWYDWSKLLDCIAWVTCGYGVKIWRLVLCILGCAVIFASLYGLFNGITNVGSSEISSMSINIAPIIIQNAPSIPTVTYAGGPAIADYLYFSAAALTGSTPTELRPLGAWKYAVVIERLIGYLFLALFVVVLTKKMIR